MEYVGIEREREREKKGLSTGQLGEREMGKTGQCERERKRRVEYRDT